MAQPLESDDRGVVAACPSCGTLNRLLYERMQSTAHCTRCNTPIPLPDAPVDVTSEEAFSALTGRSAFPVLIDFWAPWCGPCKMVEPEVRRVAAEGAGRWLVGRVNTEELTNLAARLDIRAIPLLVVYKTGREMARQVGAARAAVIRQMLEQVH